MIDFIKDYYDIISWIFSFIITLFCLFFGLLSKKRGTKSSKLLTIVRLIPTFISEGESMFESGHGSNKLNYVLNLVRLACSELNLVYDPEYFKTIIEDVLSTPQKK